jgi:hypothetical protein
LTPISATILKTLASLRRVNQALSRWDEWDAHDLMPLSLRPGVVPPVLEREQLKALQRRLIGELTDLAEVNEPEA